MAISRVEAVTVGDLLADLQRLRVPDYQRPYSWTTATALQLLDDIRTSFHSQPEMPYVLGSVILHAEDEGDDSLWDIVDGQQRLVTLRVLTSLLEQETGPESPGASPLAAVRSVLRRRISAMDEQERHQMLRFITAQCELVRIVTTDIDEAFRIFDSQNFRGRALAPHDLLKAHHLREMNSASDAMKAAVVERWESVRDEDLDRLFSAYLYRIAKWIRAEETTKFTVADIGLFKGLSRRRSLAPSERYHVVAQTALPLLSAWNNTSDEQTQRDQQRSRFQLDAPAPAGEHFFDMVSFLLDELTRLVGEAFDDQTMEFCAYEMIESNAGEVGAQVREVGAKSRYRYVTELYIAVLLYYTNLYGDDDFDVVRDQLFGWAYLPRVRQLRVQYRTIDKRARGEKDADPRDRAEGLAPGGLFSALRNSTSGGVIHRLAEPINARGGGHEAELTKLLEDRWT